MGQYVNLTLRNAGTSQHVYHATDDVLGQQVLPDTPLEPDETAGIQLVADENGYGRMTYGYRGGVDTIRNNLSDGDRVDG
jgi:hypothetical protein